MSTLQQTSKPPALLPVAEVINEPRVVWRELFQDYEERMEFISAVTLHRLASDQFPFTLQ